MHNFFIFSATVTDVEMPFTKCYHQYFFSERKMALSLKIDAGTHVKTSTTKSLDGTSCWYLKYGLLIDGCIIQLLHLLCFGFPCWEADNLFSTCISENFTARITNQ